MCKLSVSVGPVNESVFAFKCSDVFVHIYELNDVF